MKSKNLTRLNTLAMTLSVLAGLYCGSIALGALEGQNNLSPDKVKQIKEINKGYRFCTQVAVFDVKSGKLKAEELSSALTSCKDRFPAASLYLKCKQDTLKATVKAGVDAKDINKCQRFLNAASFDQTEPTPIFFYENQAFFAGVGLNLDVKSTDLAPTNFSCDEYKLQEKNLEKASYILFGNFPASFGIGAPYQPKYLQNLGQSFAENLSKNKSKGAKDKKDYADLKNFGRIFAEAKKSGGKSPVVYFPAAPCHFQANPGKTFAGLSIFYLIHPTSQAATPYFGISYYSKDQRGVSTSSLVSEMLKRLGPKFKAYRKDGETTYLAASGFADMDPEGDPRNVCAAPRAHQFIAIVRSVKGRPNAPDYLIVANIKNLCDYGDRLASLIGS